MIVLDTNVISALMRKEPEKPVVKWLDGQPAASVWITAITVMEIRFGLQTMPKGRRQDALIGAFEMMLKSMIEGRIASFDAEAGMQAAELMAQRKRKGRPAEVRDTMIAGIVLANRATLATRNTQHFEDLALPVINPWET
jgi:predicted nucleic acid-binding protein